MPEKTPAKPAAPKRKPRAAKPATPPVQLDLPNVPAPDPGTNVPDAPDPHPMIAALQHAFDAQLEVQVHINHLVLAGRVSCAGRSSFVVSDPNHHTVVDPFAINAISFRTVAAAASAVGANDPA